MQINLIKLLHYYYDHARSSNIEVQTSQAANELLEIGSLEILKRAKPES